MYSIEKYDSDLAVVILHSVWAYLNWNTNDKDAMAIVSELKTQANNECTPGALGIAFYVSDKWRELYFAKWSVVHAGTSKHEVSE